MYYAHKHPTLIHKHTHTNTDILPDDSPGEGAADRHPAKPQLSPVKKPKDLLSPMLKIIDTKSARRRRVQTAPPDR